MKQGVGAMDCLAIWYTFQYGKIKGKLIVIAVICPVLAVPCCPDEKRRYMMRSIRGICMNRLNG
ncbi:hypothetical protein [Candidatus Weimeria sp. HCP3S3_B5]|uniref:hypothetical protein n=1 Tax=Candidatus Weimeria sp. HCP3S3_B5 TaxID=3438871 RepID=UPI003F8C06A5